MLHKGFLRSRDPESSGQSKFGILTINLILYVGVCIILAGLFFMIINLEKANSTIHIWLSFIIAGVILVFLSLLIRLNKEWHHR